MRRKVIFLTGVLFAVLAAWIATLALAFAIVKSRVPVTLPLFAELFSSGSEYVSATGTWVIEGNRQAFPLQTTEIRCEARLKRCTVVTAEVGFSDQLRVTIDFFEIVDWSKSRVVFVDDAPICVQYVYTIDLLTQSVNGVRQKRAPPPREGADCDLVRDQLRLRLAQGFDVSSALEQEAMPWFGRLAAAPLKLLVR
jgi:hypothetical protein